MAKKKGKKDKDKAGKQRPAMPSPPTAPVTTDVAAVGRGPRTKKKKG